MIDDNKKSQNDTSENTNEYDQSKGGQATHEGTSEDMNTEETSEVDETSK